MIGAWERGTGAGVAAHLARLFQEAVDSQRPLVFVRTPGDADLATWGAGAAREACEIGVIDLTRLAAGQLRILYHGHSADAHLPADEAATRKACSRLTLLCVHGLDVAFAARPTAVLGWLRDWAARVPVTMLASRVPERFLALPALSDLRCAADVIDDESHGPSARGHAVDFLNRLFDEGPR